MLDLVHALARGKHGRDVPGLAWRRADGSVRVNRDRPPIADLNSIPFPNYGLMRVDDYFVTEKLALRLSLRGAKSQFNLYSPSPGTPLYEECRGGLVYQRLYPAGANLQHEFDVEDLVVRHPEIFPQYYTFPTRCRRLSCLRRWPTIRSC